MIRVLIGAVLISFSPVFVKLAGIPGLAAAFWRMAIGGAVLVAWLVLRDGLKLPPAKLVGAIFLCSLFFAGDIALWHQAILYIGPGLSTLIANFQAVLLPVMALLLFREAVRPILALALPVALSGLWLLVGPQWQDFTPEARHGVFLGLGAACLYSLYLLILKRAAVSGSDPLRIVALVSVSCAALFGAAMLATGASFAIPTPQAWAALLGYGVLAQVLGWVFITRGMPNTPTSLVGLLLLLQPTCAYLWDVLFFSRRPGLLEVAGVILTLTGIYLGSRSRT